MERRLVSAVSPFAGRVGYSSAVRVGGHVYVAGTAPVGCDSPDPYEQAKRCLELIVAARAELGARPEHVCRAHGEIFADIRPASTMIVVAGLLDPAWKVEIEVDALIDDRHAFLLQSGG